MKWKTKEEKITYKNTFFFYITNQIETTSNNRRQQWASGSNIKRQICWVITSELFFIIRKSLLYSRLYPFCFFTLLQPLLMLFRIRLYVLWIASVTIAWIYTAVQDRVDFVIVLNKVVFIRIVIIIVPCHLDRMTSISCRVISM